MQLTFASYQGGGAVTPSDSTDVAFRALYVGTTGTLRVVARDGATINFGSVAAGALIPLEVIAVHSTGTTASNIVGLR